MGDVELRHGARDRALPLLHQRVARRPQVRRGCRVQAQDPRPLGQRPAAVVRIVIPLPLQAERGAREIVRGRRFGEGLARNRLGAAIRHAMGCVERAPDRPVVLPEDRAEAGRPPDRAGIAHHETHPAPVGQVDQRTLVAAAGIVDLRARLPRASQAFGARNRETQPARNRVEQVIIAAAADHLRSFCALHVMDLPVGDDAAEVGVERQQANRTVHPDRRGDPRRAVGVEDEAGVESGAVEFVHRPRPLRVARAIDACIPADRGDDDIEHAGVVAQAGGEQPLAIGVSAVAQLILRPGIEPRHDMAEQPPVHQIARMQQRQPRCIGEGGGDEIIVLADADDVGIGIVGEQDRVAVGAVALIGAPHLRGKRGGGGEEQADRDRSDHATYPAVRAEPVEALIFTHDNAWGEACFDRLSTNGSGWRGVAHRSSAASAQVAGCGRSPPPPRATSSTMRTPATSAAIGAAA